MITFQLHLAITYFIKKIVQVEVYTRFLIYFYNNS